MKKATKQTVVFAQSKKALMALSYHIAGFYTDENIIGSKAWHSLMWAIFGQISKTYSNDPSDPRQNFTSEDNKKIREIDDLSQFEEAYPEVAKIAKAKADLANQSPKFSAPSEPKESSDLLGKRVDRIEELLGEIASKLK